MDTTKFIVSGRDQALSYGDYSTYRAQLSRRLLATRRRLGRTTKKGTKYKNSPVTALDIGNNNEFAQLFLLTSERAWAHAMYMKSAHSTDTKGISGATRSHIISRLHKAKKTTEDLLKVLEDSNTTQADILETRAYAASLTGAEEFEKQSWEACVKSYAIAWIIYTALDAAKKNDVFKDLLFDTIEPSIRYSAYQIRIPRTVAILAIVRKYFSGADIKLASEIDALDPGILRESSKSELESADSEAASRTIKWRSRVVEVEDASIAAALAAAAAATRSLEEALSLAEGRNPKERAAAYDGILIACQDVVDATKHAMDGLLAEGVSQSDKRIQTLQITRTAVNYDMISWRVGRNRVLTGEQDGALPESSSTTKSRRSEKFRLEPVEKEEGTGWKLARLREKVVLYNSTLQSIEYIKELPGIAADASFLHELEAKYNYFRALKCLAIARSHSILSKHHNALALLARATDILSTALPALASSPSTSTSMALPLNLSISYGTASSLSSLLTAELHRHRALIELSNVTDGKTNAYTQSPQFNLPNTISQPYGAPLIENLNMYHFDGVDLSNVVTFPPRLEPVSVKPLFFDVALNHIRYPTEKKAAGQPKMGRVEQKLEEQTAQGQKKGWFSFGR